MRLRCWIGCSLAFAVAVGLGGCGWKSKRAGGEARCKKVKQGLRYNAVKKIFGRTEDSRRGSQLLHVHTWKLGKGRCEVWFSGVAVSRDALWRAGSGGVARTQQPGRLDCGVLISRQKTCVDALAEHGAAETVKSIRERLKTLPPAVQKQRLAAVEQTRKQIGQLMRQQLTGPSAQAMCERSYGRARLGPAAQAEVKTLLKCLGQPDCAGYARCYWKLVGANRVGGAPGR